MVSILYLVLPLSAILILLFSLFYFARRRRLIQEGKYLEKPEKPEKKKENFLAKIYGKFKGGKIKKPEIGAIGWIVVILLTITGINYVWNSTHTTTYTFSSKENLPSNWQINSGIENLKVENGCLVISGPVSMTLKGSENMDWTEIEITPCDDQELNDVTIGAGNLAFRYYFGPPPDTNYDWDKGSVYHVGIIKTRAGTQVSSFLPVVEKIKMDNRSRSLFIERGAVIRQNYRMSARGSGILDSIGLTVAYYNEEEGKGRIYIETTKQKIKRVEVIKGLLARIK